MAVGSDDDEVFDVGAVELDRTVHQILERASDPSGTLNRTARGSRSRSRAAISSGVSAATGAVVAPAGPDCSESPPRRASPSAPPACNSSNTPGPAATSRSAIARWRSKRSDWKYGAYGPPTSGPSSQSRPSHRSPSRMPSTISVRRAFGVGVFDAQNEHPAVTAREQPVEQRRAGAADVEVAGGRRSEADARSHGCYGSTKTRGLFGITCSGSPLRRARMSNRSRVIST